MKYLKTFEQNNKYIVYWKIPIDNIITIETAIHKIINNHNDADDLITGMYKNTKIFKDELYLIRREDSTQTYEWFFSKDTKRLDEVDAIFKGFFNITPEDIDDYKLYKNTTKYKI